jgi:hypothetical protein
MHLFLLLVLGQEALRQAVLALIASPRRDTPEEEGSGHDPDEGSGEEFHDGTLRLRMLPSP